MKRAQNWLMVLLCLALVGAIIAGCGGGGSKKSSGGGDPTPTPIIGDDGCIFRETFDDVTAGTNIRPKSGQTTESLDNPNSFLYEYFGGEIIALADGEIALNNKSTPTNSQRMGFMVPGLRFVEDPVLKLRIKNDRDGAPVPGLMLNVGNCIGTSDGQKAHGQYTITNNTYEELSITLDKESLDELNIIQLRPVVAGDSGDTSTGAGGIHIDKIEVIGSPSQTTYTLTTNVEGNGSITLDPPGGSYTANTDVTLTAEADEGWVFSHWSGALEGSVNPVTLKMDADKTVTAVFVEEGTTYTLTTATLGNGSIELNPAGGSYGVGTDVTLTADADEGWKFKEWSGDLTGSDNPAVLTMDADKEVTAVFVEDIPLYFSENFDAATTDDFWTAAYKALPNDPSKPMYNIGGGGSGMTFPDGKMHITNGGRFTIGETNPDVDTVQGDTNYFGDLNLSQPYKISFTLVAAVGDPDNPNKKLQIYIDNNTTSADRGPHGSASRIYNETVIDLENLVGETIEVESSIGSGNSFIHFRMESGVQSITIDDLVVEPQ